MAPWVRARPNEVTTAARASVSDAFRGVFRLGAVARHARSEGGEPSRPGRDVTGFMSERSLSEFSVKQRSEVESCATSELGTKLSGSVFTVSQSSVDELRSDEFNEALPTSCSPGIWTRSDPDEGRPGTRTPTPGIQMAAGPKFWCMGARTAGEPRHGACGVGEGRTPTIFRRPVISAGVRAPQSAHRFTPMNEG